MTREGRSKPSGLERRGMEIDEISIDHASPAERTLIRSRKHIVVRSFGSILLQSETRVHTDTTSQSQSPKAYSTDTTYAGQSHPESSAHIKPISRQHLRSRQTIELYVEIPPARADAVRDTVPLLGAPNLLPRPGWRSCSRRVYIAKATFWKAIRPYRLDRWPQ